MKIPELPKEPVDGFTIEWWSFEPCDGYRPGPRCHRAIYIANMTWREFVAKPEFKPYHFYDAKDREGAPFIDNWIHLNESDGKLRFDGRSEGWDWVNKARGRVGGVDSAETVWAARFATREDALVAFRRDAEQYILRQQERIAVAQGAIASVLKLVEKSPTS